MTWAQPMIRSLRWPLAGAAIVATHLALANWLMAQASLGDKVTAPEPIYVDLQPAPEPDVQPEPAPDATPEPEMQPEPETLAAPSFTPPPMTQLPALDDPADLFPPITSALALAQSERPQTKPQTKPQPKPRQEPREERQPAATPQRTEPQRAASQRTTQPAPQSRRQAAPAGPGPREIANWQAQVSTRISRHMARTSLSGRGGQVSAQISVTIGPNGSASARLATSTGDGGFDQALARQAGRMPRMPAPPGGQAQSFVLPVAIRVR